MDNETRPVTGVDYPRTFQEMDDWFRDEAACRDYVWRLRWPAGFVCPHCGAAGEAWIMSDDLMRCRSCHRRTSLTAGTIFEGTRKPLRTWFMAMWFVTSQKNGVSALGLQRTLGHGSYETAWTWLHKLRRAMVRPGRDRLGGTVEADETYVAKALGAPVQRGAIIGSVEKGSPAEAGGLKAGDIITAIDGQPVADANEVRNRIGLRERGSTVELTIWRVGKSQTVKLTVAEPRAAAVDISAIAQFGGARFTDIPVEHPSRGKVAGALVAEVLAGSPAWRLGLRTGDIIAAVNQQPIKSAEELAEVTKSVPGVLALSILRGDAQLFIVAQG
jgi:membrane-associated protease RseP (regulator of RpoE activity)